MYFALVISNVSIIIQEWRNCAPVNHTKLANVPIPVGFIKATGVHLA